MKNSRVKGKGLTTVTNIVKQPVPKSKIDTSEGITKWEVQGGSNDFPQQLLSDVDNSPSGSAAIDVWHEFTEGGGFVNEDIGEVLVNPQESLNELNSKLSRDLSSMWGVAVHIRYNGLGVPVSYRHLPFENTRLGELNEGGFADTIKYNPYFGTNDYDKDQTKWYYSYTPSPELVRDQMSNHKELLEKEEVEGSYPGQVFWFSIEKPLSRVYPKVFYYSAINWFKIDSKIQLFHERNIDNNFLLSVLINKFGDPDTPAGEKDSDGNYESNVGAEFEKDMKSFSGAENAGSILTQWFLTQEEKADIQAFPSNTNDKLFETLQTLVSSQISIGTKVPRVLLGIGEAGKLGDTQEILNAIRVMQSRTARLRKVLASIYKKIFKNYEKLSAVTDFLLKNINPVNVLPQWAIDAMTDQEKREYVNENFNVSLSIQEVNEESTAQTGTVSPEQASAQANLRGSVGGVQGVLQIQQGFADGLTSEEAAISILTLIYGFTESEARQLLGNPEKTEEIIEESIKNYGSISTNFKNVWQSARIY
jgi:hypothetical protein